MPNICAELDTEMLRRIYSRPCPLENEKVGPGLLVLARQQNNRKREKGGGGKGLGTLGKKRGEELRWNNEGEKVKTEKQGREKGRR
jgi:hypothetical protein